MTHDSSFELLFNSIQGATKFPLIGSDVEEREEEKSEGAEPTYDDDGNEISASARKPEAGV